MRGVQIRSPNPNRTPGRYPNPVVPKIALRVLAVHYPERLPAHPPWVAHEEEEVRTVRSTVPRGEYQRRGAQHVHAFFYPVQTLGETPPGAHQFVRIEYQRRGNPHGFRPGVPSTIE